MAIETINAAIRCFNAGSYSEALALANTLPVELWADAAAAPVLAAISDAVIERLLAADPMVLGQEAALADAARLQAQDRRANLWRSIAVQRINQASPREALLAACYAFDADTADLGGRAILAECAARADAPDVAAAIASTLVAPAHGTPLAARLQQLIQSADASRLNGPADDPKALAWKREAEALRTPQPARSMFAAIMAVAGPTPCWWALWDLGQMLAGRGERALALALFEAIVRGVAECGLAEQAIDECLTHLGRHTEQYDRRIRVMSERMAALLPPGGDPAVGWSVDSAASEAFAHAMTALAAHGFVVLRAVIDPAIAAQAGERLFPAGTDRRFANPGRELPPSLLRALLAALPRRIIDALGLLGPDAGTSHARHLVPGAAVAQDLLTQAYHQDAIAFYQPLANLWIPLDACGDRAPGLALLPDRTRTILPTQRAAQDTFENSAIERAVASHLIAAHGEITPVMQRGDALLFLGSVPHRTNLRPEMTDRRRSLELRFVAPGWLIEPMALGSGA